MTFDHQGCPSGECRLCRLEALFVTAFRAVWVQAFTPCRELSLTLDLQRHRSPDCPILLCVAQVHGAPTDVLGVAQVSMNAFLSALAFFEEALACGAPDADERMRAALDTLAQPILLGRAEARRAALGMRQLFPGLLEDVLAERAEEGA